MLSESCSCSRSSRQEKGKHRTKRKGIGLHPAYRDASLPQTSLFVTFQLMLYLFPFDRKKETLTVELCFINKFQEVQKSAVYSMETCFREFQLSSKACVNLCLQVSSKIKDPYCPSSGAKLKYQEEMYSRIEVKPEAQQPGECSENQAIFVV